MLKIQNLKKTQEEHSPRLNVLVYGDAGVGKTTFAASAAELGRVLLIDAESGSQFLPEEYAKNIDVLKLENVDDLDEILKEENVKDYQTIVIDSITEVAKKMCDKIKGNKESLTVGDWGKVITELETFFRKFRDLNRHGVLVALAQEKDDDNIVVKRPSLSGKNLPANVVGFQDVCIYLDSTSVGRVGHTAPSQKYWAKDRTNKLPVELKDDQLTIKAIYDLCAGQAKEASPEDMTEIDELMKKAELTPEARKKAWEFAGCKEGQKVFKHQLPALRKILELKIKAKA